MSLLLALLLALFTHWSHPITAFCGSAPYVASNGDWLMSPTPGPDGYDVDYQCPLGDTDFAFHS